MVKKKTIKKVEVKDVEKRYEPCKHYVYILSVTWSDGTTFPVYRRFSDFYSLQVDLLDCFPTEAGVGGDRILPFLPGVKLFGRTEIKKVADDRKRYLDEYCRKLIVLPEKISQDSQVLEFFEARAADINPPKNAGKRKDSSGLISSLALIFPKILQITKSTKSDSPTESVSSTSDDLYVSGPLNFDTFYVIADYKANARGEISLTEGQEVEVIEKNDNGWWLVSCGSDQGWAPASFLEPLNTDSQDNPEPLYLGETYVTLAAYTAELEDEISFPKGVIVEAMHKLLDGWWIISYNGDVGHAPATYLAECNNPHVDILPTKYKKPKKPTQRRCTIKTKAPKAGVTRDLTLYRQLSAKNRGRKLPPNPSQVMEETAQDDVFSTEDLYVNDEDVLNFQESYGLEKSCPYRQQDIAEEEEYEVSVYSGDIEDDGMYINVDSPSSHTLPRTSGIANNNTTTSQDNRPLLVPRGETLPRVVLPTHNSKDTPKSNRPPVPNVRHKANQQVATPSAFLKGNTEQQQKNKAPQKLGGHQTKGKPASSPLKVPAACADRSPSPRGGPTKPKILGQKPLFDQGSGTATGHSKPPVAGKGVLAQRIALFNN